MSHRVHLAILAIAAILPASTGGGADPLAVEARLKEGAFTLRDTRTLEHLAGFTPAEDVRITRFGGWLERREKATGFFHTARIDGRWWLVDPEGCLFLSVGINSVAPLRRSEHPAPGDAQRDSAQPERRDGVGFPANERWVAETAEVLHRNRLNTLGCWSAGEVFVASATPFPYCLRWNFMRAYRAQRKGRYPATGSAQAIYPFDPEFAEFCDEHARGLAATKDDPWLLGHFLDNELPLHEDGIVTRYLAFPESDPCHTAAAAFMRTRVRNGTPGKDDDRAFLGLVVKEYYRTVASACRRHDPNHMLLGSRFHGRALASPALFEAAGPYTDVISVNYYHRWGVEQERFNAWANLAGRPILISEWYANVGLANAGWLVRTEADRGRFYQHMTLGLLENRNCVGWHWFKFAPMFLGDGQPSTELFDAARGINEQVYPLADFFSHAR